VANNLFISYDLYRPSENCGGVTEAIQGLGMAIKLHDSLWYVSCHFSSENAAAKVRAAMRSNDTLVVIDATSDTATWYNLSEDASTFLQKYGNAVF
jgi:hypothetical protein